MITLLICAVTGAVLYGWLFSADGLGRLEGALIGIVMGALGGLSAGLLIAYGVGALTETEKMVTYNLKSISDGSSVHGSFFLGSGVISEESSFTFYRRIEPGRYELVTAPAANSQVVEDDSVTPHVDVITEVSGSPFGIKGKGYPEYIFYVPENSIQNNFYLDAEDR